MTKVVGQNSEYLVLERVSKDKHKFYDSYQIDEDGNMEKLMSIDTAEDLTRQIYTALYKKTLKEHANLINFLLKSISNSIKKEG